MVVVMNLSLILIQILGLKKLVFVNGNQMIVVQGLQSSKNKKKKIVVFIVFTNKLIMIYEFVEVFLILFWIVLQ